MTNHYDRITSEAKFFQTLRAAGFDRLASSVLRDEPMDHRTTMRVGGKADLLAEPEGLLEVSALVKAANAAGMPYFVMGNGSNIVVSDDGIDGLVIALGKHFSQTWREEDSTEDGATLVHVYAGAMLAGTAYLLAKDGFDGVCFAAGIPGSVGGAVYMNAGAYGGQMSDIVCRSTYLTPDGDLASIVGKDHNFSYRDSIYTKNKGLILTVTLRLFKGNSEANLVTIAELNAKRAASQPLNYPSAGSVFRRPEGYYAGSLIEKTGLKGLHVGGAEVSEKHAGFIVNTNGAKASDIYELVGKVQNAVKNETGVWLVPEIVFVGRGFNAREE